MTDKELLELAARAAGIVGVNGVYPIFRGASQDWNSEHWTEWNPLADDGDAFRLAATMGFSLEFGKTGKASLHKDGEWLGTAIGSRGDGPAASMRRAIVILAAKQQQE